MLYLMIFFICIILYLAFIKHDLTNPLIYFLIPWIFSILTYIIDIYHVNNQVSKQALNLITIGTLGFILGVILINKNFVKLFKNENDFNFKGNFYREWFVKFIIVFTFVFNLMLVGIMIKYLRNGISYAYIRDLLYSYNHNGLQFFNSSITQNIYGIIDAPMTYCVAPIVVTEIFIVRLPKKYMILGWLSVGEYVLATGGRLILMFVMFQFIFVIGYYKKNIPWRKIRNSTILVLLLCVIAITTTIFRVKSQNIGSLKVNSIYAYFNINFSILTKGLNTVDYSGVEGHGLAFFGGIFQLIDLVLNKLGINLPSYENVSYLVGLPQKSWVEIYTGNWYNAFDTMFYDFYIDFREWGVFLGSLTLGLLSKWIYVLSTTLRNEKYIFPSMIMIEVLTSSFFRWQFGTFTFTGAFLLSFFIVKDQKKNITLDLKK